MEGSYCKQREQLYTTLRLKLCDRKLVDEWLNAPQPVLDDQSPLEYMRSGHAAAIDRVMYLADKLQFVPGVGWIR